MFIITWHFADSSDAYGAFSELSYIVHNNNQLIVPDRPVFVLQVIKYGFELLVMWASHNLQYLLLASAE